MADIPKSSFDLVQFCAAIGITAEVIIEIVEIGIIEPPGSRPEDWIFDAHMLGTTRHAIQLQRDLQVDWAGIALALNLIEERNRLQREVHHLRARLERFIDQAKD